MEKTIIPFQNMGWTFLIWKIQLSMNIIHSYELGRCKLGRVGKVIPRSFLRYIETHVTYLDLGVMVVLSWPKLNLTYLTIFLNFYLWLFPIYNSLLVLSVREMLQYLSLGIILPQMRFLLLGWGCNI